MPVRLALILDDRENGGNSKGVHHSGYRGSEEEGHMLVADVPPPRAL